MNVPPHLQTESVNNSLTLFLAFVISCTLKMEATRSSETSVHIKPTRLHIPEDDILHSHRRGNLKSYNFSQDYNTLENNDQLKLHVPTTDFCSSQLIGRGRVAHKRLKC
jgi:hypothetical protein